MKRIKIILGLVLFASVTIFAQSPRIKLNQIIKDTVKGSVLISSPSDSGMVYSRDFYIAYGADTVLILYGDTLGGVGGGFASVLSDGVTITGDGTTGNELKVDTSLIATLTALNDSLATVPTKTTPDSVTITGNGSVANPLKVDTFLISTIQGLVDSLSNYVLKGVNDTISGQITLTDTLTLTTYDEGGLSVNASGTVKTEPTFRNLSLGEGYADVAKEYHYSDGKTVYPSELGYNYAELLQADVLSKTSLILTPTAIADSVVASQKPLSSDGDFIFSRSTAATRVNENGYIEKETQNLLTYSNDFSNAAWTKVRSSVTSGVTDPFGGSNAWSFLTDSTADQQHYITQGISQSGVGTFSMYAKANGYNWIRLRLPSEDAYFDLANGVTGSSTSGVSASMTDVGNGWYRCEVAISDMSTSLNFFIHIAEGDGDIIINGTPSGTDGVYIYAAQLEQGLVARDYIETTTSAVYGGVTDNVPRIDYTDKTPSLLLEPQRTNSLSHSEYFNAWTKVGASVTDNNTESPEGYINAAIISVSSTNDTISLNGSTFISGDTYTASVYLKGTGTISFVIGTSSGGGVENEEQITLSDNWVRHDLTYTAPSTTGSWRLMLIKRSGDTTTDFDIYGAQLEQGSYATSYIPTYGTAVTRNADNCSNTNVSHLIGQTEGTIFIKTNDTKLYTDISDSTSSNRIVLYTDTSGYLRNLIVSVDTTSSEIQTSTTIAKGDKIAMAYKGNDVVIYKNGLQIGSDTSVTVPSTKQINVGTNYASSISDITNVNNYLLFKTRLSNTELAKLTKQ